ncbi:hypothetical protein GFS60_06650 (plasmid) [Rhodococcus sp. WAY2]|nr:hypothetical protein GFS60_06650 [Rhodococcus sp. WAY2]
MLVAVRGRALRTPAASARFARAGPFTKKRGDLDDDPFSEDSQLCPPIA